MLHENEPAGDETPSSLGGTPDEPQNGGEPFDLGSVVGWMQGAVQTTMQGMAEKLGDEAQRRAAAVHTAKLILGDGKSVGEYLAVGSFILGEAD